MTITSPLRPIDRPPPAGFQVMTVDEANSLPWHSQVMLWDGSDLWTAWVHSFTEDALNVQIVRSGARISLELWNPDLEDGPAYPPRDREGTVVAVTLTPET